ncbi:MAG: RidA family protein [Alphaproteobacteria bacterium]|nr:RidA family protein [Alphaproteobacteria bacterium]
MTSQVEKRLEDLGLVLPVATAALANYIPFTTHSNVIIISGQLPMRDGQVHYKGKVGSDLSLAEGQDAARLCGLNILTQLKAACDGNLDRVEKCLRIGGFVNCGPDFTDQPKVINGVSDLMVEVFGADIGRHARAAVGVNSLPLGAAVEVEAMFRIRD